MITDVERQRGFPHARPGRHDDQLARMKTAGDVIEIDQSSRQSRDGMAARIGPNGDQIHRLLYHVLELERLSSDLILGDTENLALGSFEKLLGRKLIRVSVTNDLGRALD